MPPADSTRNPPAVWYRQPVVWLGAAVFIASMAGCVWLIVVGANYRDTPLKTAPTVFGVPTEAASAAPAPASTPP